MMRDLYSQFEHPRGFGGWLAGQFMLHRGSNRGRARWVLSLLEVAPQENVLDVGCGPGYSTGLIARKLTSGKIVAVDRSALMTHVTWRRLRRHVRAGRLTLICADVAQLPRFDVRFDKVISVNAFQFFDDPVAVARVLLERMAPGGRIAFAVQPRHKGADTASARQVGERMAEALAAAGFERIERHFSERFGRVPCACALGRAPAL
jgi:trans-aconitate methyltransferase